MPRAPLSSLCKAFGNPERVRLIACLAREANVSDLLKKCSLSQSALSQHLGILRAANAVTTRRAGREIFYRAASNEHVRLARLIITLTTTS